MGVDVYVPMVAVELLTFLTFFFTFQYLTGSTADDVTGVSPLRKMGFTFHRQFNIMS